MSYVKLSLRFKGPSAGQFEQRPSAGRGYSDHASHERDERNLGNCVNCSPVQIVLIVSRAQQIRVLDGSSGRTLMNMPSRPRRWDVHGDGLPIDGQGADVIVDWIADDEDESSKRRVNRLMGVRPIHYLSLSIVIQIKMLLNLQFTAHGELPALVVYTTPNSPPTRPTGYGPEASLHDVLDAVSQDDSLRAKFR